MTIAPKPRVGPWLLEPGVRADLSTMTDAELGEYYRLVVDDMKRRQPLAASAPSPCEVAHA